MSDTVIVALISGGTSTLVAIAALVLNYRGFSAIDSRFGSVDGRMTSLESRLTSFENRVDGRFVTVENRLMGRLEAIQADLKEFYKTLAEQDKRITRLEDRP